MKPVEPGCWAMLHGLVVFAHLNGSTVRVKEFNAEAAEFQGEPCWYIDISHPDGHDGWTCERHLLRIDGDPGVLLGERQDDEVPA